jgi:hypothetical protein
LLDRAETFGKLSLGLNPAPALPEGVQMPTTARVTGAAPTTPLIAKLLGLNEEKRPREEGIEAICEEEKELIRKIQAGELDENGNEPGDNTP